MVGHFSVKTCEVFGFIAIVRIRVYYVDFFVFFFTSLVSVAGFYTEDEPYGAYDKNEQIF